MKTTIGTSQLLHAIASNDRVASERLFGNVVNAALRETNSEELRRSYCETIGAVIGILNLIPDQSPISSDRVLQSHQSLSKQNKISLISAYDQAYKAGGERAKQLMGWIESQQAEQPVVREANLRKLHQDIGDTASKVNEVSDRNKLAWVDQKLTLRQNKLDKTKLENIRHVLNIEQNTLTPGHPGPAPVPPVRPDRNAIQVSDTETKYDSKGNKSEEKRLSSDIERERDSIYNRQQYEYNRQMAIYEVYRAKHTTALSAWFARDVVRQADIKDRIRLVVGKWEQIVAESKATTEEHQSQMNELKLLRNNLANRKADYENARMALESIGTDDPMAAIRRCCLDVFSVSNEKERILKSIR